MDVDLYWSLRSSYSYLALDRIIELKKKYSINVRMKLIFPLAIRQKNYFINLPKNRKKYGVMDNIRIAEYYNVPFEWPQPDPVKFNDGVPDDDQSLIHFITRLGVAADMNGLGFKYVEVVSRLIWDGRTKGWDKNKHIENATNSIGLDYKKLKENIDQEPSKYDQILEKNANNLEDAGHWGVPTMVFQNEPFFGQDRIDLLEWRIKNFKGY